MGTYTCTQDSIKDAQNNYDHVGAPGQHSEYRPMLPMNDSADG